MSEFAHQPVLLSEVLQALRPRAGKAYLDGCCGGAGHSLAILEASNPTGFLYACDQDGDAISVAHERLNRFEGRFELRRMNFCEVGSWIPANRCAGVLLDLGVSSYQLDTARRGFSFQHDGPLDMRMDQRRPVTAADLVNTLSADELADIFWKYGGERESRRIARALVHDRSMRRFETTSQLANLVERVNPRRGRRSHPATQVFQALRIVVNDEMESLTQGLQAAMKVLESGGRLAVITFQSDEDRLVRDFMRSEARDYDLPDGCQDFPHLRLERPPRAALITRKAILPGEEELTRNPRSRSAQLRVMEKL